LLLVARGSWLRFARIAYVTADVVVELPVIAVVVVANVFAKLMIGCCCAAAIAIAVVTNIIVVADATDVVAVVLVVIVED